MGWSRGDLSLFEVNLGVLIPKVQTYLPVCPGRYAGKVGQMVAKTNSQQVPPVFQPPWACKPGIVRSFHLSKEAQIQIFFLNLLFCK